MHSPQSSSLSDPAPFDATSACLAATDEAATLTVGQTTASVTLVSNREARTYRLATTAELRDNRPPDGQVTFSELPGRAVVRTGNLLFDGLYALAINEAQANSVSNICDDAYGRGEPIQIDAFETGELWKYVWTRDVSYALELGMAGFDPARAVNSLLFKASDTKASVVVGTGRQIVQDTGSGGSYPVSTDRTVWAMGAHATLKHLLAAERSRFLAEVYPILRGTIEQDRHLVFDPTDGLYRGEQSFLDWREQTYPGWTRSNVLTIAMSKALSVNAANYFLLTHAADYARRLGHLDDEACYAGWANGLRAAVNRRFWDPAAGLYCTYLLSDDGVSDSVAVARYDLLGQSLAILTGLADEAQASSIVTRIPVGSHGPPVVWPQEKTVPIYHNQGTWPFVTAYGIKAARHANHPPAVDAGITSLLQQTALHLSNMENFDFISGRASVAEGPRLGPQVNSRRQLWSVAGYLSMVQDVVFGLETSLEGIRFQPYITAALRNDVFSTTDVLEWRGFTFQGKQNDIRIQLPPLGSSAPGVCAVQQVELNGEVIGGRYVAAEDLQAVNEWHILLQAPEPAPPCHPTAPILANCGDERMVFAPVQPSWNEEQNGGITLSDDRLTLHYAHADLAHVTFDIYRDNQRCASGVRQTQWTDPDSGDHQDVVRSYRVTAVDTQSGNVSHLTPALAHRSREQRRTIPARSMHGSGELVDELYFARWGRPDQELASSVLTVDRRGRYLVRAEFANGAGPINTGLACAVKKLEIRNARSGETVAAGYLVMPQSGDWTRYDLSSAVVAELQPGEDYTFHVREDEHCLNMSYLQSNERYTAFTGGGASAYNQVNLAALHLLFVAVHC